MVIHGWILVVALLAAASTPARGTGPNPLQRPAASLCTPTETPLFACPIGRKLVSVCGLRDGTARYRFGRLGRVELQAANLAFSRRAYSGGGELQIAATNGRYRYIVYDRVVRTAFGADGLNHPAFQSGLLIQRSGKIVADRQCGGGSAAMGGPVERYIREEPFADQ